MRKKDKFQIVSGFTLIEMLVVLTIFALVMVTISGIFLASLRASFKSESIKEVKQNGNYALSVITRALKDASELTSCTGTSRVDYKDADKNPAYFECVNNTIASGSATIRLTSNSVSVSPCSFVCVSGNGQSPTVNIDYTVARTGTGNTSETATIKFKTQVTLRAI